MDSNLGEIREMPLAIEMFNRFAPGMLDNPMIEYAHSMSLSELLGAAPEAKPLFEEIVKALNRQEDNE